MLRLRPHEQKFRRAAPEFVFSFLAHVQCFFFPLHLVWSMAPPAPPTHTDALRDLLNSVPLTFCCCGGAPWLPPCLLIPRPLAGAGSSTECRLALACLLPLPPSQPSQPIDQALPRPSPCLHRWSSDPLCSCFLSSFLSSLPLAPLPRLSLCFCTADTLAARRF